MLGRKANLRGTYRHITDHLKEIQVKVNPRLRFKEIGDGWRKPIEIWYEDSTSIQYYTIGPLNPPLLLTVLHVNHDSLERFSSWLYDTILNTNFERDEDVIGVFDIHDRKTLKSCFQEWPKGRMVHWDLEKFFEAVRLIDGLELAYSFPDGVGPWIVVCRLQESKTWVQIQETLRARNAEIPLEQKYGLSVDAAALLKWILGLRKNEYLNSLTPAVEDHVELDIGLEADWDEDNLAVYIELLIEEINEKTELDLRVQPWKEYSKVETRIRVKRKRLELENVVHVVQMYGLGNNCVLPKKKVEEAIQALFKPDQQ